MTSAVDICNRALAAVGTRSTIASLTEGSNESNNCSLIYEPVLRQAIRAAHWNCFKRWLTLSLLKAAPGTPENETVPGESTWQSAWPAPPWQYEYAQPSDCVQMRKVVNNLNQNQGFSTPLFGSAGPAPLPYWQSPGIKFEVASDQDSTGNPIKVILTNVDQAIGVYSAWIDQPDAWDDDFQEAVVEGLAGRLVLALTGDKQLAQLRYKMANDLIATARARDANEGQHVQDHMPDWIVMGHGYRWLGPALWGGEDYMMPYGPLFTLP